MQFSGQLRFSAAVELVDYLDRWGSTPFTLRRCFPRKESSHGYDVTDPNMIHPDFGSEAEFAQFADEFRRRGRGLMMDVVPNHMAIDDENNVWWQDVLENGRGFPFAKFFDIDWNPPQEELRNKILVPVLGDQYGKVLENGELRLVYEAQRFSIHYYRVDFPSRRHVVEDSQGGNRGAFNRVAAGRSGPHGAGEHRHGARHICRRFRADAEKSARRGEQEVVRRRLASLVQESTAVRQAVDATIREFNGRRASLAVSIGPRHRRWRSRPIGCRTGAVAADEINYRRFFDINELAATARGRPRGLCREFTE